MLRIRDLSVEKAGSTICLVHDLEMRRGERVAVIGPNGSGKTTLLRVVSGLERGFAGECQTGVPLRDRVYVHQSPYLFRGSVLMNATYGLAARHVPRQQQVSVAHRWLRIFGIDHLAGRRCAHLSRGERRRLALVRAFAIQADMLLLDEPLADLDQEGVETVCRVISTLSRSTILISSPIPLPKPLSMRTYWLADAASNSVTGPESFFCQAGGP